MRILEGLNNIENEKLISFHMPGHKNGRLISSYFTNFLKMDITEIPGADNLHNPKEIILETENLIRDYYGSDHSYILVNGSTSGIYSAIMSIAKPQDFLIISRECHRSVYSALALGSISPLYLYPNYDEDYNLTSSVNIDNVKKLIDKNNDVVGLVLTSPNYLGIISDIESIANLLHSKGKILIVDEAHGSHLKLNNKLPKSALELGADIVVQSFHKTLPALTQSSVLHVKSKYVDIDKLEMFLSIHQTSSPSYLLMASVDAALDISIKFGEKLIDDLLIYISTFKDNIYNHEYIRIIEKRDSFYELDPTRIVIVSKDNYYIDFFRLEKILRKEYSIQVEYSFTEGLVLIATIANIESDFLHLEKALNDINFKSLLLNFKYDTIENIELVTKISLREAIYSKKEIVNLKDSIGRISGDFLTPYPPGVPLLAPGELITSSLVKYVDKLLKININIIGVADKNAKKILVLKEEQRA